MGLCQVPIDQNLRQRNAFPLTELQRKTMKRPYVSKACPAILKLEKGKEYNYCNCGLSKNQPFCDGSHEGTPFTPVKFTAESTVGILCLCKRTDRPPYCDNTHKGMKQYDF